MNQSPSPISEPRNEGVEVSRRLYKSMMDTSRQLDDLRTNAKTTGELFTVQAQVLRTKLKEIAERLLFSNSLVQRNKIEEVLWRKGFYEDVSTAKRLRKDNQWLPNERSQLVHHLKSGVGFYHHLLLCLQTEFGIFSKCIDFPMIFPDQVFGRKKSTLSAKLLEAACDSIHRCLICLGDLNRYLMDIPPCGNNEMAYRYYHQAISWNPDIGMPHNQLGTLSLSTNCNLDAVFHYMRCLMCTQPFEGAEGNLKRTLDRSAYKVPKEKATFSGSFMWRCHCLAPGGGQLSEPQDYVQQFITHFLLLADVWFFDKKPIVNISDLCHQTLLDFRQCLCLMEPPDSDGDGPYFTSPLSRPRENFPSYLSKDMVLKIVVVTMICLFNLRKKGSDQSSSLVAFLLAIFCLLMQQVQEHFQESVLNLSLPTVKEVAIIESEKKPNGECSDVEGKRETNIRKGLKENGLENGLEGPLNEGHEEEGEKPTKRMRIVRRRNMQCNSAENSDESNDEECILSVSSDEGDDEEVVLDLSSDDDEEGKEVQSKENDDDDDVVILEEINEAEESSKHLINGHNGADYSSKSPCHEPLSPVDVLEQVTVDNLLAAIKVCADWLQGDKSVIEACGKDSPDLFKRFVDLVNVINIDLEELGKDPTANSFLKHQSIFELESKVPLPEDAQLQKLPFLSKAHENLNWELIRENRLTSKEEALIRIQRLLAFCKFLQTIPETGVTYDEAVHKFSVSIPSKGNNFKSVQAVSPSCDLQRREEVMHSMGQLWLRAEVQNLETSVKKESKGATFPPYVVLDADALTKYYQMVGQLMASRKFIMVVPSVVLTALDQLKRESVLARDAIRWLEFQFQKGSRFLRAQTTHEALHLPLVSYPKQKSREAWSYFQILECCYYLNHQSSLSRSKGSSSNFVTLLTGHGWAEANDFSPIGVAKAVGIAVEHIESFFAKWKTSTKSHG